MADRMDGGSVSQADAPISPLALLLARLKTARSQFVQAQQEQERLAELGESENRRVKGHNGLQDLRSLIGRYIEDVCRSRGTGAWAHVYNVINGKVTGVTKLPAINMGRRKLVCRNTLERWKRTNERDQSENVILSESLEVGAVRRMKGQTCADGTKSQESKT
jgi:hypothetical protein